MAANLLHIRIKPSVERQIRSGHPWVYAESIREMNRQGTHGETAVIFDRNNKFLAIGMFDPDSPIQVRVLHTGKPLQINEAFWKKRMEAALNLRKTLFNESTNGFRLINGENDGFPGLVLDRYADCLVLKLYTSWWLPLLNQLREWILQLFPSRQLILRLSRNVQEKAESAFNLKDGFMLFGPEPGGPVLFLENGLRFEADVLQGQKTGFFLDQRENRQRVRELAAGKTVINTFSFTGGFSVYAAQGGARSVTDVDISKHALEGAARNFAHNHLPQSLHQTVQANVFDWFEAQSTPICDLLVIDPPSLAKRELEKAGALNAYSRLVAKGCRILHQNGWLVAASCSAHVPAEDFFATVLASVQGIGRPFREMGRTQHPADHPATFAEARYLKCIYLHLDQRS